jgi:phosphonoacetaldehyde hydrolase
MENSNRIRAVIFDWAGTMVDYGSRAPAIVFQEIFRQEGVEITAAQAREPMGMAKREHIAAITQMPDVADRWQQKFGKLADDNDVDRMYEKFLPLQKSVLSDHSDMIPGAVETFQWCLENGIKVGSSTGYTRELMEVVSPLAKSAGYDPEVVLCAEDAPQGRPAPWLIFECAKRLDVYPMNQIVKVDDTVVGIHAGINAGTWTVGVALTGNLMGLSESEMAALPENEKSERLKTAREKLLRAGAHLVVDDVTELPAVINDLNEKLAND